MHTRDHACGRAAGGPQADGVGAKTEVADRRRATCAGETPSPKSHTLRYEKWDQNSSKVPSQGRKAFFRSGLVGAVKNRRECGNGARERTMGPPELGPVGAKERI